MKFPKNLLRKCFRQRQSALMCFPCEKVLTYGGLLGFNLGVFSVVKTWPF